MKPIALAVTGVGVVSPIGVGYAEFADSLVHGVTGLAPYSADGAVFAGELLGWDVRPHLIAEKTYLDRCSELALAAVKLCLDDAGLAHPPAAETRSGLVLGTAFGCLGTMGGYAARIRQRGPKFATPVLFSHSFSNTPASLVAIDFRLRGYHATVTHGETSGEQALITAAVALAAHHADAVLAGGVEALCPDLVAARGTALAVDDPDAFDPFAAQGTPLGEGGAVLLLERLDDALARGATPRAVLIVGGDDQPVDLTLSRAHGAAGECCPEPASALAGLYGETLGAAGALAAAAAVAALERGCQPPVQAGPASVEERHEPQPMTVRTVRLAHPGLALHLCATSG